LSFQCLCSTTLPFSHADMVLLSQNTNSYDSTGS
jgi:hypothetical protein